MKFIHLGDLHLGKNLGEFDLIDDQKYILNQILDLCTAKEVDAVLIAGDVYDKAIPSEKAVDLLDDFLNALAERKINVFVISGNHDSDGRLNYGSRIFRNNHIYITSVFGGELAVHTLQDEFGPINIYSLPFVKASQVRHYYENAKIENYEDAVRTVIEAAAPDPARRNVILAHQFVAGRSAGSTFSESDALGRSAGSSLSESDAAGDPMTDSEDQGGREVTEDCIEDPVLSGSEGLATKSVGTVEKIGCNVFDCFDYAALGHIHGPQRVGRAAVRYSGSPLKYSLSEVDNEKSVPIVTLREKGDTEIELVPLKPMRDLRHITGKMKDLLNPANVIDEEDFIYVTLTDEEPITDCMGIFQQTYPNTVKIDYRNSHSNEIEDVDLTAVAETQSFAELISDFYKLVYGCDISDEEMKVMREAAGEAGVIDEAE